MSKLFSRIHRCLVKRQGNYRLFLIYMEIMYRDKGQYCKNWNLIFCAISRNLSLLFVQYKVSNEFID